MPDDRPSAPLVPSLDRTAPGRASLLDLPDAALAVVLADWARKSSKGLCFVTASEERSEQLARMIRGLVPSLKTLFLPGWDSLPYDRVRPSPAIIGQRMVTLAELAEAPASGGWLLTTTIGGLLRRVPARAVLAQQQIRLQVGEKLEQEALRGAFEAFGYVLDDRVDLCGEAAFRGNVIDIFPAGSGQPFRIDVAEDRIAALRRYDALSQRTEREVAEVTIRPVKERLEQDGEAASPETVFDYIPEAVFVCDRDMEEHLAVFRGLVQDAYQTRLTLRAAGQARRAPKKPETVFLTEDEIADALSGTVRIDVLEEGEAEHRVATEPLPSFRSQPRPLAAAFEHIRQVLDAGDKVVLAAANRRGLEQLARQAERSLDREVVRPEDIFAVLEMPGPVVAALRADMPQGVKLPGVCLVSSVDIVPRTGRRPQHVFHPDVLETGDIVVHTEHGLGRLTGLQTVEGGMVAEDAFELEFAGEDKLLVPIQEIHKLWRYGSALTDVPLDRLGSSRWQERKAQVEAELAQSAKALAELVRERQSKKVAPIAVPQQAYARFAGRFRYPLTADQANAIEAVLDDLRSGHLMNRLVCGDVGFGKTEVALRAAAAVALSGQQVALIAPTTLLARQHFETFRRRFSGLGIRVGLLSGTVSAAEASEVRAGLKDGTIQVAVGTHALLSRQVAFKSLGLLVIDEEQRFGTQQKEKLKQHGQKLHVLTLTATPIPRTLQGALSGLQDLSVIATPPVRRLPVRTVVMPFDPLVLRQALMREHSRGGQSFVVCPRIADIPALEARLHELVPELDLGIVHGRMAAVALEEVMIAFAEGALDILLSTNVVETGLDVPCANTMIIWRPDHFGLAQLHQLRGRVGRGHVRASVYLFHDPEHPPPEASLKRLHMLEEMEALGSGFAISAQDLDQRGAGELLGAEQAGHVSVLGTELYQHLLRQALRSVKGESGHPPADAVLHVPVEARLPQDYVPDDVVRLRLYRRLMRLEHEEEVADFLEEMEDRFGPVPPQLEALGRLKRLKLRCGRAGIARVEIGPQAIAVTLDENSPAARRFETRAAGEDFAKKNGRLIKPLEGRDGLEVLEEMVGRLPE
ncbi:DEAD/DEAH box helicase [Telmatospirillum sp. J64-1]|uniref:DEAD/DEAH box helicase n=1 Tax=Telmatospirillum sp. J64-1 TaxID=2502183 RepID=UPI00115C59CE|nr:DEAD/DEAH box helicase [Telmatospirillum sp. J64-1]